MGLVRIPADSAGGGYRTWFNGVGARAATRAAKELRGGLKYRWYRREGLKIVCAGGARGLMGRARMTLGAAKELRGRALNTAWYHRGAALNTPRDRREGL